MHTSFTAHVLTIQKSYTLQNHWTNLDLTNLDFCYCCCLPILLLALHPLNCYPHSGTFHHLYEFYFIFQKSIDFVYRLSLWTVGQSFQICLCFFKKNSPSASAALFGFCCFLLPIMFISIFINWCELVKSSSQSDSCNQNWTCCHDSPPPHFTL